MGLKSYHNIALFYILYLVPFNHVKTHLWIIMMEFGLVMVLIIMFMKYLTLVDSLVLMGIKI